jgi:signal transduction histidine kinase
LHFYLNLAIENLKNVYGVDRVMNSHFLIFIFIVALSVMVAVTFIYVMWRGRRDELKLINIIHGSPIPTFVISKDHKVMYWNRALQALSSIRPREIVGTDQHWRIFYKEKRPCLADIILDKKVEQIPQFYSGQWAKSNLLEEAYEVTEFFPELGEKGIWFRITSAAIRDSSGDIFGAMETLEDITEQKIAEEELLRRSKVESLGMFADGVAKDFDGLLTAILRNVFLAKISATDEDKIVEDGLAVAERAGLQAKELAHRLITFAQGGYPVRKLENLEQLLRESVKNVFNDSQVPCEISIAQDLWPSEIDSVQIKQVIENILINAREAVSDGGIVKLIAENIVTATNIRTLGRGRYIRIIIKDNGVGIPKENLPRIFDPYFTTKEKSGRGGIGLGLAICDSIIKNHEGLITVESVANVGTSFSIYLTAAPKDNTT